MRGVKLPNTVEAWMRPDYFSNPTSLADYWEYAWILNFVFLVLLMLCVITPDPPPDQWPSDTLDNAVQKPVTLFENLPDNRWIYPPSYQVQCFDGYSFILCAHLLHPARYEWQLLKNQGMFPIWPNSIYHMGKGTY